MSKTVQDRAIVTIERYIGELVSLIVFLNCYSAIRLRSRNYVKQYFSSVQQKFICDLSNGVISQVSNPGFKVTLLFKGCKCLKTVHFVLSNCK